MIALAVTLLLAPQAQDEDRLKTAWPKLVEAWKSADTVPSTDPGDEFLKAAGRLHSAFEAANLYASDGEYVPLAFKTFLKARFRGLFGSGRNAHRSDVLFNWNHGAADPMKAFVDSINRLKVLEQKGLDDEDNVQDEVATARKALKSMGVTADDTPPALRRRVLALARALAMGDAYPEPARATDEKARAIRDAISGLSHESIEEREKAARDLQKFGEAAFPFLRETLKSGDAEAVARAKSLLGIGHAPWTAVQAMDPKTGMVREVEQELIKRKMAEDLKRAGK